MNTTQQVDILSPQFKANPFPLFENRRANQPVFSTILPDKSSIWLLTRYEDVNALLKDTRFAKNKHNALTPEQLRKQPWVPPMFRPLERNMLDLDQPDHTRLRSLVHKAFTPHLIDKMRTRVQSLADELLERVAQKGEMDFIRDYALPLPLTLITEILGVPPADRDKFHKWSKVIVSVNQFNNNWRVLPSIWQFNRYLRRFFKVRRADPKDDLVSALIEAEEAGDKLSEDELLAMVFLLLVAGHETTVNLIGNGTLALLQHPDQMEKLRGDAALIKPAVEELLRYTSPVFMSTERYAREDVIIHGVTIKRGEMVLGVIGSANRDEAVFEKPNDLDITRDPNKHLSFGQGIHFCLGAPLARLEAIQLSHYAGVRV
jgi:cytochrome P450 PksS